MVPHPSSPDVDRRPVELSSLVSSVAKDVLPGRREYATLTDLDHRRHVAVFTVDVGRRYSAKTSTPKGSMNRYSNILPYDRNRVVLRQPFQGCDYINASWIRPPKREPLAGSTLIRDEGTEKLSVIAAQGPLPSTLPHFLQMLLECETSVILMLTKTQELNSNTGVLDSKCEQYWPNSTKDHMRVDGGFTISLISETKNVNSIDDVDMRVLRISKGSAAQECVQFHMTSWPDFGVTNTPAPVVRLISMVRAKNFSGSMVVHCSAGVGRTGTSIALLRLMEDIDAKKSQPGSAQVIDIFKTVLDLRKERGQMVQRKAQYRLLYQCVAWYIRSRDEEEEEGPNKLTDNSNYVYYSN